jgi:hypothetical protein
MPPVILPPALPIAKVFVDFPKGNPSFVDVIATPNAPGSTRFTPAIFTLQNPQNGTIWQDSTGTLKVNAPVVLQFIFAIGYGFRPVAIALKQTKVPATGKIDSNGRRNLPKATLGVVDDGISPGGITITNVFSDPKGAAWKIYMLIQDDQGNLGVIDPGVENTDQLNARSR